MNKQEHDLGMVGLGVMGRNLVLNMADHGHSSFGMDKDVDAVVSLRREATGKDVSATQDIREFVQGLRTPRAIVLLVPAGKVVDLVLKELTPLLSVGDMLIDSGNSHFEDTNRRQQELEARKLLFAGMGISGGESGARRGPSLMPGGPREVYDRVSHILEDVAANVNGEPCVAHLGSGSAGHFVKMVHNGIEYGVMQLLAETYDLMKRGLGLDNPTIHKLFTEWNQGELSSYLLEITAKIIIQKDDRTDGYLLDMILDVARQKGTGKWTSQDAMDIQVPTLTIDAAVSLRDMSSYGEERAAANEIYTMPEIAYHGDRKAFLHQLRHGLYTSMLLTYAQGMSMLSKASEVYGYGLDLETVARIWRGGCIIRAALLEDLREVYKSRPDLPNPLLDPKIAKKLTEHQPDLREVVRHAAAVAIPAAAHMASLAYLDSYRTAKLPANLIQAQRDFFGAHCYERIDERGVYHHTQWE